KQIGDALHNHLTTHTSFPPGIPNGAHTSKLWVTGGTQVGAVCQGPNWLSNVLSEMEDAALWTYLGPCMDKYYSACDDCEHNNLIGYPPIGPTPSNWMLCPSADRCAQLPNIWTLETLSKGNYAACWGSEDYMSWTDPHKAGIFGVVDLGTHFTAENVPACLGR